MDPMSFWGLGVSIIFAFLRYLVPSVPPLLASCGIAIGVLLVTSSVAPNDYRYWPIMMMILGLVVFLIGAYFYYYAANKKVAVAEPAIQKEANMEQEKKDTPTVNITGSGNITTFGQNGNNTINQAPEPDIKVVSTSRLINSDGTHTATALIEIVSPYPPGSLQILAKAPDIISFEANAQRTGIILEGHSGKREGYHFRTLMSPFGQYMLVVRTKSASEIDFEYSFQ